MRVISGMARGRKLKEPEGRTIRPTTDKVKESIFNIVQFDIEGRRCLDLFAGTGQLGIEALSRGAAHVTFVDEAAESLKLVKNNLDTAGFTEKAEIIRADAIEYLERGRRYDLIFIDPPYKTSLLERALKAINQFDILKVNGIMICERNTETELPELTPPYRMLREYNYGKIKITTLTRDAG